MDSGVLGVLSVTIFTMFNDVFGYPRTPNRAAARRAIFHVLNLNSAGLLPPGCSVGPVLNALVSDRLRLPAKSFMAKRHVRLLRFVFIRPGRLGGPTSTFVCTPAVSPTKPPFVEGADGCSN
jgi:hypothetical protein